MASKRDTLAQIMTLKWSRNGPKFGTILPNIIDVNTNSIYVRVGFTCGGPSVDVNRGPTDRLVLPQRLVEPKDGLYRPRLLPMHPLNRGSRS